MNILVISNTRCGGRYFSRFLSKRYKLKHLHEVDKETIESLGVENSCIKILPWRFDETYLMELTKKFDYVFIIDRKNKKEQIQSLVVLLKVLNADSKWSWNDSYYNLNYELYEKLVKERTTLIETISKKLNKKIIYYEDLYYNTEKVDLLGLEFIPDKSKKLRDDRDISII